MSTSSTGPRPEPITIAVDEQDLRAAVADTVITGEQAFDARGGRLDADEEVRLAGLMGTVFGDLSGSITATTGPGLNPGLSVSDIGVETSFDGDGQCDGLSLRLWYDFEAADGSVFHHSSRPIWLRRIDPAVDMTAESSDDSLPEQLVAFALTCLAEAQRCARAEIEFFTALLKGTCP